MTMYPEQMRSPLPDYLRAPHPGTSEDYVVLPKSLVQAMPLQWQSAMTQILQEFHQTFAHLNWPEYRVIPSRKEKLVNVEEEQLAEVGYSVEIDVDVERVYRESSGRRIDNPEEMEVLVAVMDPIPGDYRNANQDTPPRGFPAQQMPAPWS